MVSLHLLLFAKAKEFAPGEPIMPVTYNRGRGNKLYTFTTVVG